MTDIPVAGLRVLAFCDYFGLHSSGGAERVAAETYERLADQGAQITLVSGCPPRLLEPDGPTPYRVVKTRAIEAARFVGAQVAFAPGLAKTAQQEVEALRPQVIHAQGLHFHGSVFAARLARRVNIPLVTTAHLGSPEQLPLLLRTATNAFEHTASRFVLRRSDDVIAVSHAVAGHIRSLGARADRVHVVPNGVNHDVYFPAASLPPADPPEIGFVGRLIANKGPAVFVEALARLAGQGIRFRAVIIGGGPLERSLARAVEGFGLADRVTFAGHVNDVADRLRTLAVMVRPSTTEGMPLAVLEAMASGVCVVASDVDGNRELISDGVNGALFRTGDVDALTRQLANVLGDAALRTRLARAGRAEALAHSWDACAAATGEVLAEAARRNAAGTPATTRTAIRRRGNW